jgi:endonuclease-3 related protein
MLFRYTEGVPSFYKADIAREEMLRQYFSALQRAWRAQNWWPAETAFEVIVGAYLTQNTSWTNVERALHNLRAADVLSLDAIREIALADLEAMLRPAGYFRQKAQRLKRCVSFLDGEFGGSLDRLFTLPTDQLRTTLLGLNGVGPETADSILLYAGNHPVFVVDAYTRRIFERHGLVSANDSYDSIRLLFERALGQPEFCGYARQVAESSLAATAEFTPLGAAHFPSAMSQCERSVTAQIYNEMHALLVGVGKNHCFRSEPECDGCPLKPFLRGRV